MCRAWKERLREMTHMADDDGRLAALECDPLGFSVSTSHRGNQETVMSLQPVCSFNRKGVIGFPAYRFLTSGSLEHYVPKNSTHSSCGNWWKRYEWYRGGAPHLRI